VTLIEVILALALITLVSGLMFAFYDATLRSRDWGTRQMGDSQLARVIGMKIGEEIRSAVGTDWAVGAGISGKKNQITIQTVSLTDKDLLYPRSIKDAPVPPQYDLREVKYYLAYNDEENHEYPDGTTAWAPLGLVRREKRNRFQTVVLENKSEMVDLDLLAPEMKYLRFRYFDGIDWWDDWQASGQAGGGTSTPSTGGGAGNQALPLAVEVTVGYAELPPEEEKDFNLENDTGLTPSVPDPYSPAAFSAVFRLLQADESLLQSRSGKLLDLSTRREGGLGGGGLGSSGG
jgi:hypothetical protein